MPKSSGVILQTVDASFFLAPPKAHPSNIYVVSYKDGGVRSFTGAPSAGDRWGSRFCYIVDTAEHQAANSCTVQSSVDAYAFTVEVAATWRVTDAETVVRAGVTDGNTVVLGWIQDEIWQIGRTFPPESAAAAEIATRTALAGVRVLAQGITVLRATARFRADSRLTEGRLRLDEDALKGQLEERGIDRLRRLDGSDESAIREHLLRHPDDTGSVLQMLSAGRERDQALRLTLLKEALDHGFITDADAQPFRDLLLGGQGHQIAAPGGTPLSGPKPPLSLPPGVSVAGAVRAARQGRRGRGRRGRGRSRVRAVT